MSDMYIRRQQKLALVIIVIGISISFGDNENLIESAASQIVVSVMITVGRAVIKYHLTHPIIRIFFTQVNVPIAVLSKKIIFEDLCAA